MLKFNKSTLIALYAMMELAKAHDETVAAAEIAERNHVSRHHLSKVLQQLVRSGLVRTTRGAAGGHGLGRDPEDITLLDVVEVFEGRRSHGDSCLLFDSEEDCRRLGASGLRGIFEELAQQVAVTLESISLKTLVKQDKRMV